MYSVLIADDEPKIRRGLRNWIQESDLPYEVVGEAENGREALRLAGQLKPRVCLVDINMPYMNGLDFVRQLKKAVPGSRVIVISGYDNFEYVREALRLDVFDYLLKPVPKSDFRQILGKLARTLEGEAESSSPGSVLQSPEELSSIVLLVKDYIEEHYSDRELNLQKVAAIFKINKTYLSRLMKKELNDSFVDYVTKVRIQKAMELLSQEEDPVRMYDIAMKVGFSSQHYFSRVFRNQVGLSPVEYRRSL